MAFETIPREKMDEAMDAVRAILGKRYEVVLLAIEGQEGNRPCQYVATIDTLSTGRLLKELGQRMLEGPPARPPSLN